MITDQLDSTRQDLSNFSLGPIAFGDKRVTPPQGLREFAADVDLRPAKNLIARLSAKLELDTGLVSWRFASIDPATGQPTNDPLAGFLPPNVTPTAGEGHVLFTVMPKKGLATGTEIRNQASIVFDTNAPINTPQWLNSIDNTPPSSRVLPLPASQTSSTFTVQWSGMDSGSGVGSYTIYVSENGGSFAVWLRNINAISRSFTGTPGNRYSFYSIARDLTGNMENSKTAAEASTIVLTRTPPTITWPVPAPMTYGTPLSATQLNATSSVPGTFAYTPAAGTVLSTGSQTLSVTFTPIDTAAYTSATATVTVIVNKAMPVISWPPPATITYGTALSAAQLNATTTIPGSFVYSPPVGTVLPAGNGQTLSVSFTPTDTTNYTPASLTTNITVGKANGSVTPAPASKRYGQADPAPVTTGTLNGFLASDNVLATYTRAAGENAGEYAISVTLSPASVLDNYLVTYGAAQFTITRAPASVTPNDVSTTYGTPDPPLTGTLTGFLAADTVSASYSRTAGTSVGGSAYIISASLSPAAVLNNYRVTYNTGKFVINKAVPGVMWPRPAPITYGTPLSSTQLNATASVPGSFIYTPAAGTVLPSGNSQALTATFVPADTVNYSAAAAATTININKAPLTVTANNATRIYLLPNPALTASYSGFVNGDNQSAVSGAPALSTTATSSSSPGAYPITLAQGTLTTTNYTFNFVEGLLTVTPAAYVTNAVANTVSVLNPATNTVLATIPVGKNPVHVSFSPNATRAYVINAGGNSVSVVNTGTNAIVATPAVGANPVHAAVSRDGSRLYVVNGGGASVSVINTGTNVVAATVPVGRNPVRIALNTDGTRAYVANAGANNISVINTSSNAVVATINAGSNPVDLVAATRVYVVNAGSDNVSVVNPATNAVVATVPVGDSPVGIALAPDGATAYVVNGGGKSVSVLNSSTNTVAATIPVGAVPARIAIAPDGAQLYITNTADASVSVIRTNTNTVIATPRVGVGPADVSVTPDGATAYVVNGLSRSVSVINTASSTVAATIAVGAGPVSVAAR